MFSPSTEQAAVHQNGIRVVAGAAARRSTGRTSASTAAPVDNVDTVTLSSELREDAPIRHELVKRVRRQIADGTYLNDARLERTVDRVHAALSRESEKAEAVL